MTGEMQVIAPATVALIPLGRGHLVPTLIAHEGKRAGWRYVEFFTADIRNPNTRRAYVRACIRFFAWCEARGLTLATIRPFNVAAWIEGLQQYHSAPGVKQQLAAVRMLFDWLITGQVMPSNPAAAVRGPKHVVKTGRTPVLDGTEWRQLIDAIPTDTVRDLRDRALIATLTYFFARIGAALKMKVEDLRPISPRLASPKSARASCSAPDADTSLQFIRAAYDPTRRLAHDWAPSQRSRHHRADRQPFVPDNRDHRLSRQWRRT